MAPVYPRRHPASAESVAHAIVEIRQLDKKFRLQRHWRNLLRPRSTDVRAALRGVDLSVERGECFGVLGQNGAGKSTLFRILATLVLPDAGSATVGGFDVVTDAAAVRRVLIPVVPGERSLYWRVSAEENLRLFAALYHLKPTFARRQVREVLELVGLEEAGRKQVGLFSSGMKQRLLIGRALLGRPDVLLLDEPTRSLDPIAAREFRTFLRRRVLEAQGTTILLATHDHEEVTELCNRVAVLDGGELLALGPTQKLLGWSQARQCSLWTPGSRRSEVENAMKGERARILSVERVEVDVAASWDRFRIELEGDESAAAGLLTNLVRAGIPVSRFTRDDLSLADLLQRIQAERDGARSAELA